MSEHKHEVMIKAWAENVNLFVFFKCAITKEWYKTKNTLWEENLDYFICLPKHENAVLELLNGGNAQVLVENTYWSGCDLPLLNKWEDKWWYMNEDMESRIKPKKITRYAYAHPDGHTSRHYKSIEELNNNIRKVDGQLITFEIEI